MDTIEFSPAERPALRMIMGCRRRGSLNFRAKSTRYNALGFLQSIYRDRDLPLPVRTRAAIEALLFESPKLSATAILTQDDFATGLDRAIARSGLELELIEARPVQQRE